MIHKNAQNGHVLITMSVFVIYLIYYIYKGLGYLWIRNLPNTPGYCHFSPASAGVLPESLSVHWNTMGSTTFPSLVSGCCLQLWSLAYGFYSITDIYFMYIGVTSGFLSEAAWSAWPPSSTDHINDPTASVDNLIPDYYPRPTPRLVSCYALFKWMAASKPTS